MGCPDETQFAARNPHGVDPLDDLSALVFEPVTSTAHAPPAPRVTLTVKGAAARSSSAAAVVAALPRSASILPESTPRTLTDFSPPADHLGLAHFAELLLDRPTEPTWSNPLYDSLLSFFTACADPAYWTSRPDDLIPKTKQFHLSAYLTSHQPNKSEIQAAYRPGPESGFDTLSSKLQAKVSAMSDVMRWLWEDSSLTVSHVCGLVRHAPLSIFFLVREYSSVVRLSELVQHAERELRLYLFSLPLLSRTAHESAAEMLLNWLNMPAEPDRHYLFFCRPDGALRSERPWDWWFDRAETSQSVQMWMLDAWEAADEQEAAEVIDAAHSSTAPTQPMEESGYSKRKRKGRKARQRAKARLAASAEVTATVELPSSARPQTPLPPRSLLPALPSRPNLPVFLSSDLLFPDLSRLRITHFDAFLRRPVEPAWSAPMYECILRFLLSRAPAERWHPDPARLAAGDQLPSIAQEIRARQPNEQAIRACFQPRDAPGFDTLTAAMQAKFYAMQLVMRWMWGDATLNVHAVTDLVQRAPLALHILVREFSSSVRLFDLVETSERNLRLYLSSLALPTPFQQAAIRLLDWLNTPAEPNRHYLFFCTPEGALRSERPWEWWDALAETQGGARTKDLDNWEKTLLARERWGT
ncbi:hypothetical protein Rhopal_005781-T1 [Rhodotorula paludigena]|uniref:Proteophosphoglycan ppg4 n=1 Tax=Rhodotorula paludigena TaxID=86838 RepID=A0AAV5GRB3_9BASI|nr:hypothetical protein Rhopal_005781-T1 [Rhodotorula paludigena]